MAPHPVALTCCSRGPKNLASQSGGPAPILASTSLTCVTSTTRRSSFCDSCGSMLAPGMPTCRVCGTRLATVLPAPEPVVVVSNAVGTPPNEGLQPARRSFWPTAAIGIFALVIGGLLAIGHHQANSDSSPTVLEEADNESSPVVSDSTPFLPVGTAFSTVQVSPACNSAMAIAANVPLSVLNDAEFVLTARACLTVDEWATALYDHPAALGMTALSTQDVYVSLIVTCKQPEQLGASAGACADARAKGYPLD